MKLTREEVEKLAHLARLNLTSDELTKYSDELTEILDYVNILSEVDTSGTYETSQVTGLSNVSREDIVDMSLCTPDELLEASPLPKKHNQIRVTRII